MTTAQQHLFPPPEPQQLQPERPQGQAATPVVLDFERLERIHEEHRSLARALCREFVIDEDEALQTVLFWRTEEACRRYLRQRWFRHEIEYRTPETGSI
jgi:hypothetical protein